MMIPKACGAIFFLAVHSGAMSPSSTTTAAAGGSASLDCVIPSHMGETAVVSWIRRRDFHILTLGQLSFTSDARFMARHRQNSRHWTLGIKYVQKRDEGVYECQVSEDGRTQTQLVTLAVTSPRAVIAHGSQHYIKQGTTFSLECSIEDMVSEPTFILWYHNGAELDYNRRWSKISAETRATAPVGSSLSIADATPASSGNYTCSASGADPAHAMVHVVPAEKTASSSFWETSSSGRVGLPCVVWLFVGLVFGRTAWH